MRPYCTDPCSIGITLGTKVPSLRVCGWWGMFPTDNRSYRLVLHRIFHFQRTRAQRSRRGLAHSGAQPSQSHCALTEVYPFRNASQTHSPGKGPVNVSLMKPQRYFTVLTSDSFDLPPSQIAKPLPPTTISKKKAPPPKKSGHGEDVSKKSNKKRKRGDALGQDAPRAFKRLMAFAEGKRPKSGLDNGVVETKKEKKKRVAAATAAATVTTDAEPKDEVQTEAKPDLKIRPGERLSEFNQRVDAALPISGLVNKTVRNGKDPLGLKVRRTLKERKMHKMYDEWREQDKKIKEKREEELEELEEKQMEEEAMGVTWKLDQEDAKKRKKKGKGAKYIGMTGGKEEDPWEEIKKKRGEAKVKLNEVAEAPPDLKLPGKKLLVKGATVEVDNIPKAAGSLRQREELQGIREDVVAAYRKMMAERRPANLL